MGKRQRKVTRRKVWTLMEKHGIQQILAEGILRGQYTLEEALRESHAQIDALKMQVADLSPPKSRG